MTLAAALLLARVACAAPAAPPAPAKAPAERPTPEALRAVDEVLEQAEAKVAGLEAAARSRREGDGCPPGIGVSALAADLRGRRLNKELGGDLPDDGSGAKRDWQVYHICRALAAGSGAPCSDADAIAATKGSYAGAKTITATYAHNCEVAYHQTRTIAARLRGDARRLDLCREDLPYLADFKTPADADAVCRALDADRGAPHEALLAAMEKGLSRPLDRPYLLDAIGEMLADPARCAKVSNAYFAATCRALDEYRGVVSGKAKCATGLCRVLAGEGEAACAEYSRSLLKPACAGAYAASYAAAARTDFDALSARAQAALDRLDAGAVGAAELALVGARFDRLYAQRSRFDKAAAAYAPAAAAPPPPPKRSP